ncbi:hypothetical protein [Arthrobacter sp. HS15c]|uniref:hypothetical protein n=1 Tax=Arthrobacter sp. HS15c TaxID=3230279 RepID=UPI003465A092
MASVDFGSLAEATWSAAPSGSTPSVALTRPDGTPGVPGQVTFISPTQFSAAFTADMAGRWLVNWISTGTAGAYSDVIDVWPTDPRFLIPLKEAEDGLKWTSSTPAERSKDLRLYVAAATPVIEDITGPMLARTEVHSTWGGGSAVVLPGDPTEVVSVEVNGEPLTEFFADLKVGILYGGSRLSPISFSSGEVVVTYTVGSQTVPPNIRLAVRELVRHWWQIGMQANGGAIRGQGAEGDVFTPSGYAVPRRVMELCAPNQKIGGFA